jgi:hypothetical protein
MRYTELLWAIELHVMFHRWCTVRLLDRSWLHDRRMRRDWVRMNMRLGDGSSHKITALRKLQCAVIIDG